MTLRLALQSSRDESHIEVFPRIFYLICRYPRTRRSHNKVAPGFPRVVFPLSIKRQPARYKQLLKFVRSRHHNQVAALITASRRPEECKPFDCLIGEHVSSPQRRRDQRPIFIRQFLVDELPRRIVHVGLVVEHPRQQSPKFLAKCQHELSLLPSLRRRLASDLYPPFRCHRCRARLAAPQSTAPTEGHRSQILPRSTGLGSGLSSTRPVAISTISLASWLGSRGRDFLDRSGIIPMWHGLPDRQPRICQPYFKLMQYPALLRGDLYPARIRVGALPPLPLPSVNETAASPSRTAAAATS